MLSAEEEEQAECRPLNGVTLTDLFFSEKVKDVSQAKSYCFRCPIMLACLRENLDEAAGVFGGLAEGERKQLTKLLKKGVRL